MLIVIDTGAAKLVASTTGLQPHPRDRFRINAVPGAALGGAQCLNVFDVLLVRHLQILSGRIRQGEANP